MKKKAFQMTAILLINLIMAAVLFGCKNPGEEIAYKELTIRAFGYSSEAKYPVASVCASKAELDAYIQSFNYIYKDDVQGQTAIAEAAAKYDDPFFESKALILVLLQESSGSTKHTVNMLVKKGNVVTVDISRESGEVGTTDMALWQLIFEVDQSSVDSGDTVKVNVND